MASKSQKTSETSTQRNAMIKGRFQKGQSDLLSRINASIDFDKTLYEEDIEASIAHAAMLAKQGLITDQDYQAIENGLTAIRQEIKAGTFTFSVELEDIHMNIEARLKEKIGNTAGRLHTARSRNDQVATDFRLWCRRRIDELLLKIHDFQTMMIDVAEKHTETIMPGFTHLQVAQPITFAHHLMAYVEMMERDCGRLRDCRKRLNECPLGSAALAGTSYPINREQTATTLGFDAPTRNSMDSVSDRDFAMELLAALAITGVHLSRLAEEIILWASPAFGFVSLPDEISTGSSIMPQKRNPDGAELVRGKAGRVIGALNSLMITMKGLPLAYSKDMQEDKEPVFDAVETSALCLDVMSETIRLLTINKEAMAALAEKGYPTATDAADWMVKKLNISFREAHEITGKLVSLAEKKQIGLSELQKSDLTSIDPRLTIDILKVLNLEHSVASRTSLGGTAPTEVRNQIRQARKRLKI